MAQDILTGLQEDVITQEQRFQELPTWELSGKDLLELDIQNLPTLVDPLIPQSGLIALAGASDTGKSSLLRQLAISVVTRKSEFLGFPLNVRYGSAIYVTTEDDQIATSFFLNRINQSVDISGDGIENLRFIVDSDDLVNKLDKSLSHQKADLVIVDCFTDLYGQSMNEANRVRTFLNEYGQLVNKHKCLIIFLHHVGKNKEAFEPSKHHLLGSQGFEAKMRLVLLLLKDQTSVYKRHLCVVKGNYLPDQYKNESYVLNWEGNRLFANTGDRIPFEELTDANKTMKKDLVLKLHGDGQTQKQIADELGISQSTVSRCLKT